MIFVNPSRSKKYLLFSFILFAVSFIAVLYFIPYAKKIHSPYNISADAFSCLELDKIEEAKNAWGEMVNSHPYYNRPHKTKAEWKEVPSYDRPDLAFELDFLKTMDPALGQVPIERLHLANREVDKLLKQRAPIPNVNWVERGPNNVGGRTRAIMFDPNDGTNKKVWAGGVGGGLWFTNDITVASPVWNKVNDLWNNIAITTIAYNPNNIQEFYVGTGEGWQNTGGQSGSGIWKTTNGGGSWTNLANTIPGAYNSSSDFHYIQKIVVKSNGHIFAATKGYFINVGGILRSTDGGNNWALVLDVYTGVGNLFDRASDIEVASNGDLYCSFGNNSDGKVFKSTAANNGNVGTWSDLSASVGIGSAKRIELACAPSNSMVVYAVGHGGSGSNDIEWIKRTVNAGTTWSPLTIPKLVDDGTTHFTKGQAWYDLILAVHPTNADLVIAGGLDLHRSTNGGTNWTGISHWQGGFSKPYLHGDQHGILFRPGASNEVLFGNDGGVWFSTNAGNSGATPTFVNKNTGYNVTQFYSCAGRNDYNSHYFLAGSQDNGTQQFSVPQAGSTAEVVGGDGGFCHVDQLDADLQFASYVYNNVSRSFDGGNDFYDMIADNTGHFINPSDFDNTRKIFYAASNNNLLKRVTNITGVPVNTDIAIAVGTSMVSALKVSPHNDVVFLGIANGQIYKFSNASTGAPTLTRIDNGGVPVTSTGWVSSIDVGGDDNHLLVTYSNYGTISVWHTANGGANWTNKEGNLPDIPIRWAIYNPDNREQVIAATEIGVWTTDNLGYNSAGAPVWGTSNNGLANTRCDMLDYRAADKVVLIATHGRGLFTTDVFVPASVANFTANVNATCSNSLVVKFTDTSFKPNASWAWDINNNGTTDYTTQNPTHTYSSPGAYSVKLTINAGGTSITKQNYIVVMNSTPTTSTGCTVPVNINLNNAAAIGIYRFALGSIDNTSPWNDGSYQNYVCTDVTSLDLGTMYNATVQTGWFNAENAKFYIDYNDNGTFEGTEICVEYPSSTAGTRTMSFTTPTSGVVTRKGLRARIISNANNIVNGPCHVGDYGQAEDYTVYFNCTLMVTQTTGTAVGSLPSAINCANNGDTIRISAALAGQTINIGVNPIALNKNLVFIALGANTNITGTGTRVFDIAAGKTIEMQTLALTAGTSLTAGAISNAGMLKLHNVNIYRNTGVSGAILLRNNPGATCNMTGLCFIWG